MEELRRQIDIIDELMLELFLKRMAVVQKVAAKKKALNLQIVNREREGEVLSRLVGKIEDPNIASLYPRFINNVMELSKAYQEILIKEDK